MPTRRELQESHHLDRQLHSSQHGGKHADKGASKPVAPAVFSKQLEKGSDTIVVDQTSSPPLIVFRGVSRPVVWVGFPSLRSDPLSFLLINPSVKGVVTLSDESRFENPEMTTTECKEAMKEQLDGMQSRLVQWEAENQLYDEQNTHAGFASEKRHWDNYFESVKRPVSDEERIPVFHQRDIPAFRATALNRKDETVMIEPAVDGVGLPLWGRSNPPLVVYDGTAHHVSWIGVSPPLDAKTCPSKGPLMIKELDDRLRGEVLLSDGSCFENPGSPDEVVRVLIENGLKVILFQNCTYTVSWLDEPASVGSCYVLFANSMVGGIVTLDDGSRFENPEKQQSYELDMALVDCMQNIASTLDEIVEQNERQIGESQKALMLVDKLQDKDNMLKKTQLDRQSSMSSMMTSVQSAKHLAKRATNRRPTGIGPFSPVPGVVMPSGEPSQVETDEKEVQTEMTMVEFEDAINAERQLRIKAHNQFAHAMSYLMDEARNGSQKSMLEMLDDLVDMGCAVKGADGHLKLETQEEDDNDGSRLVSPSTTPNGRLSPIAGGSIGGGGGGAAAAAEESVSITRLPDGKIEVTSLSGSDVTHTFDNGLKGGAGGTLEGTEFLLDQWSACPAWVKGYGLDNASYGHDQELDNGGKLVYTESDSATDLTQMVGPDGSVWRIDPVTLKAVCITKGTVVEGDEATTAWAPALGDYSRALAHMKGVGFVCVPDGSDVVVEENGDQIVVGPDGSRWLVTPDGGLQCTVPVEGSDFKPDLSLCSEQLATAQDVGLRLKSRAITKKLSDGAVVAVNRVGPVCITGVDGSEWEMDNAGKINCVREGDPPGEWAPNEMEMMMAAATLKSELTSLEKAYEVRSSKSLYGGGGSGAPQPKVKIPLGAKGLWGKVNKVVEGDDSVAILEGEDPNSDSAKIGLHLMEDGAYKGLMAKFNTLSEEEQEEGGEMVDSYGLRLTKLQNDILTSALAVHRTRLRQVFRYYSVKGVSDPNRLFQLTSLHWRSLVQDAKFVNNAFKQRDAERVFQLAQLAYNNENDEEDDDVNSMSYGEFLTGLVHLSALKCERSREQNTGAPTQPALMLCNSVLPKCLSFAQCEEPSGEDAYTDLVQADSVQDVVKRHKKKLKQIFCAASSWDKTQSAADGTVLGGMDTMNVGEYLLLCKRAKLFDSNFSNMAAVQVFLVCNTNDRKDDYTADLDDVNNKVEMDFGEFQNAIVRLVITKETNKLANTSKLGSKGRRGAAVAGGGSTSALVPLNNSKKLDMAALASNAVQRKKWAAMLPGELERFIERLITTLKI